MKRLVLLLLISAAVCIAEPITLTQPAVIKAERSMVSVKAGTVVELISRTEKTLTVRYQKITGTISAASVASLPAQKSEPKASPTPSPETVAAPVVAPSKPAVSTYGKAVEKARVNAASHDGKLKDPLDEVLGN